jgi:hypothetical protein
MPMQKELACFFSIIFYVNHWFLVAGQSAVTHPHPFSPTPTHAHDEFEPENFLNRFVNVLEYLGDLAGHLYVGMNILKQLLIHLSVITLF